MKFSQIEHGSDSYQKELALRDEVLRVPLGLRIADDDLSQESSQWHFGLFDEERLIATVIAVPRSEIEVQIRQMAVSKHYQGQGYGREIMEKAEKLLSEKGVSKLYLHARQAVIKFYSNLGYSPVGAIFSEIGIPHQKMGKRLE